MIIDTPNWDLTKIEGVKDDKTASALVYEPAEDTFLMLDSLEFDLEQMIQNRFLRLNKCDDSSAAKNVPLLVVELGSGAGLLITSVAKVLNNAHCVAVDINPVACLATLQTSKLNDTHVDVMQGDLLSWMQLPKCSDSTDTYGPIDILIFNPPYVRGPNGEPAPNSSIFKIDLNNIASQDQLMSTMVNAAWLGGGPDGTDILKRSLHQAADLLSERGVFYLLMIDYNFKALMKDEMSTRRKENQQGNLPDYMVFTIFGNNSKRPLACQRLLHRHVPGERLAVYRIYRPHVLDCTKTTD